MEKNIVEQIKYVLQTPLIRLFNIIIFLFTLGSREHPLERFTYLCTISMNHYTNSQEVQAL